MLFRSIFENLCDTRAAMWCRLDSGAKTNFVQLTYNGSGNGAFLAVVAVRRINKLRAVNILISSTPAASTIYKHSQVMQAAIGRRKLP